MTLSDSDFKHLQTARLFSSFKKEDVQLIAGAARVCTFEPGQLLFNEGEPAVAFFVVLSGWVILCRNNNKGERTVIHLTGPGESFGEALILPESQYPVSAEAASSLRVAKLATSRFRSLILQNPELALSLISGTFVQLKTLVDRIERDSGWSAQRRVASFLVSLCGKDKGQCSFVLPVEQQLIAARLSMSPATLSRTLAALAAVGVHASRGRIVINDVAELRRLATRD